MCKTHNVCGKVPLNEIGIRAIADRVPSEMSPHIKVPVEFELLTALHRHSSYHHPALVRSPSRRPSIVVLPIIVAKSPRIIARSTDISSGNKNISLVDRLTTETEKEKKIQ